MSSILRAHAGLHACEMKNVSCCALAARVFCQVYIELYCTYAVCTSYVTLHLMSSHGHRKNSIVTCRVLAYCYFYPNGEILVPLLTLIDTVGYILRATVLPNP